jgi:hypothetical protein
LPIALDRSTTLLASQCFIDDSTPKSRHDRNQTHKTASGILKSAMTIISATQTID